jgi:hypothetical protein
MKSRPPIGLGLYLRFALTMVASVNVLSTATDKQFCQVPNDCENIRQVFLIVLAGHFLDEAAPGLITAHWVHVSMACVSPKDGQKCLKRHLMVVVQPAPCGSRSASVLSPLEIYI